MIYLSLSILFYSDSYDYVRLGVIFVQYRYSGLSTLRVSPA